MSIKAKKEPFRISVNDQYQLEVSPEDAMALDVVPNGHNAFHVLNDSHAFRVELLDADYARYTFTFRIEGQVYKVHIADFYARLIQQLGMHAGSSHRSGTVKAPMPGLVLKVLVQAGQSVQKGDPLLILEAMKMENVIKSPSDGVVQTISVQGGQAVEKGATLIVLE